MVHVDDFLCSGLKSQLQWLNKELTKEFELKTETLGPDPEEKAEISFLGRKLRWKSQGIELEGDCKHVKIMLEEWDMTGSKSVGTPGTSEEKRENAEEKLQEIIERPRAKIYRRAAARLNYIALDRIDIGFASKECSRGMANPTEGDILKIKRVLRYRKGIPRTYNLDKWQNPQHKLEACSDSDWAGCVKSRKSTSGGLVLMGCHLLAHWSSTQATVALSVGEAELNAMVKATAESIGLSNLSKSVGMHKEILIHTDSSSAKGTASRKGCGKLKHLEAKQLWIQDVVDKKQIKIIKVPRAVNIADAPAHHWTASEGDTHFPRTGWKPYGVV